LSLSHIFVYGCIFNVPESYAVEIQVMHKSNIEVLLVINEMNPRRKATIQTVVIYGSIAAVVFVTALVNTYYLSWVIYSAVKLNSIIPKADCRYYKAVV
jgi:ABC-type uncharacterized transport system permease subunit